jgi:hypothetical protein
MVVLAGGGLGAMAGPQYSCRYRSVPLDRILSAAQLPHLEWGLVSQCEVPLPCAQGNNVRPVSGA